MHVKCKYTQSLQVAVPKLISSFFNYLNYHSKAVTSLPNIINRDTSSKMPVLIQVFMLFGL